MLPTEQDLAKLYDLSLAYGKASAAQRNEYIAAMDRIGRDTPDFANKAGKEPEVRRLGKLSDNAYRAMVAEMEAVNNRFPGLSIMGANGFCDWETGAIDKYKIHVANSIRDLALKHWDDAHTAELEELRKRVGPKQSPAQFKPGEYAFRGYGVVRVTRVFKHVAHAEQLATGESETMQSDEYRRISQRTAKAILRLIKSRGTYLAERGIAA